MIGRTTVGLVLLGRRDRKDLQDSVTDLLADHVDVVVAGALDEVDDHCAAELHRPDGDHPVHVPVTPHLAIDVPRDDIRLHVQGAIDRVIEDGADLVAVLCAADIGALRAPVPLVEPAGLMTAVTAATVSGDAVDVVVPHEGQRSDAEIRWKEAGFTVTVMVVPPYRSDSIPALCAAAADAAARESHALILDCFGFGPDESRAVREHSDIPVVTARSVTAAVVAGLANS